MMYVSFMANYWERHLSKMCTSASLSYVVRENKVPLYVCCNVCVSTCCYRGEDTRILSLLSVFVHLKKHKHNGMNIYLLDILLLSPSLVLCVLLEDHLPVLKENHLCYPWGNRESCSIPGMSQFPSLSVISNNWHAHCFYMLLCNIFSDSQYLQLCFA